MCDILVPYGVVVKGPLALCCVLSYTLIRLSKKHIYIYGIFGREITKYTVINGVYIRFWPTLLIRLSKKQPDLGATASFLVVYGERLGGGGNGKGWPCKIGRASCRERVSSAV